MPLKMKVLQYSLLSPVDASMDSRGVDFSDIDAGRSDAGVVEGIAGGRGLLFFNVARFRDYAKSWPRTENPRSEIFSLQSHVLYLQF